MYVLHESHFHGVNDVCVTFPYHEWDGLTLRYTPILPSDPSQLRTFQATNRATLLNAVVMSLLSVLGIWLIDHLADWLHGRPCCATWTEKLSWGAQVWFHLGHTLPFGLQNLCI